MKAIATTGHKDANAAFELVEMADPVPGSGELKVRIEAISVNPVDTKVRQGAEKGQVLGWDAVGVIEDLGKKVSTDFHVGDRVYYAGDISKPGCYAELQCIDARLAAKAPTSLEREEAAALPLTSLTAWEGLFDVLGLNPTSNLMSHQGETLLVINGAGGVGSMVTQLASKLTGLKVITTASQEISRQWSQEMGADLVVDHHHLVDEMYVNGIEQVDYIFCCHDIADHWVNMQTLIRPFGHIVAIAETERDVDINEFQRLSVTFGWEFMFSRALNDYHPEHQGSILSRIARMVDNGELMSTLSEVMGPFDVEHLIAAHQRLEEGHAIGKLVLTTAD